MPGEKIVGHEDFSQDSIGDFPAKWNTNAAGEIVTVAGKPGRWLKLTRAGVFIPELMPSSPTTSRSSSTCSCRQPSTRAIS